MRIGPRDLNAFRAANGGSDSELALDATLPEMLKDPLTRRALGLADASAVAAFFVPFIMTNEEVGLLASPVHKHASSVNKLC